MTLVPDRWKTLLRSFPHRHMSISVNLVLFGVILSKTPSKGAQLTAAKACSRITPSNPLLPRTIPVQCPWHLLSWHAQAVLK